MTGFGLFMLLFERVSLYSCYAACGRSTEVCDFGDRAVLELEFGAAGEV